MSLDDLGSETGLLLAPKPLQVRLSLYGNLGKGFVLPRTPDKSAWKLCDEAYEASAVGFHGDREVIANIQAPSYLTRLHSNHATLWKAELILFSYRLFLSFGKTLRINVVLPTLTNLPEAFVIERY